MMQEKMLGLKIVEASLNPSEGGTCINRSSPLERLGDVFNFERWQTLYFGLPTRETSGRV